MRCDCIINKRGNVMFQGEEVYLLEDSWIDVHKTTIHYMDPDNGSRSGFILYEYSRFGSLQRELRINDFHVWSDGYIRVSEYKEYLEGLQKESYYINVLGRKCPTPPKGCLISMYGDGLFMVRKKGKVVGYCNADGKMVIRADQIQADPNGLHWPFSEGLAAVVKDEKMGFINRKGEIVIDCKYDHVNWLFKNGFTKVKRNGKEFYIDKQGKEYDLSTMDSTPVYHDGLTMYQQNGLYGFKDEYGDIIIPAQYERAGDFSEGLAYVERNGQAGFIDTRGEFVISLNETQSRIPYFNCGLALIRDSNQYDIENKPVINNSSSEQKTSKVVSSHLPENNASGVTSARLVGTINTKLGRCAISVCGNNAGDPLYYITCKRYDNIETDGYTASKLVAESFELEAETIWKPFFSNQRRMYVSVASFPCSLDDLYSLTHNDSVSINFGNQVDTLAIRLTEDDVNQLRAALDPEYKYTPVVVKENKTEGKKEKEEKQEKENVGTKKQIQSAIQRIKAINWNRDREKLKTLLQDPYSIAQIKRLNTLTTGEHAILSFVNGIKKKYNTTMLVQDIKRVEENERYNNKHTIIALFRSRDTTYSEELKRFLYDWHCAIGKKTYY